MRKLPGGGRGAFLRRAGVGAPYEGQGPGAQCAPLRGGRGLGAGEKAAVVLGDVGGEELGGVVVGGVLGAEEDQLPGIAPQKGGEPAPESMVTGEVRSTVT